MQQYQLIIKQIQVLLLRFLRFTVKKSINFRVYQLVTVIKNVTWLFLIWKKASADSIWKRHQFVSQMKQMDQHFSMISSSMSKMTNFPYIRLIFYLYLTNNLIKVCGFAAIKLRITYLIHKGIFVYSLIQL